MEICSRLENRPPCTLWSSTCRLTRFFCLLNHVIYLKLTKVSQSVPSVFPKAESWVAELLFMSLNNKTDSKSKKAPTILFLNVLG